MDRREIERKMKALDENPGWYQNIDLKNGMQTKTRSVFREEIDHPRTRWNLVKDGFTKSFAGKDVLDLGCNAGFFGFKALELGAKSVLGIDSNQGYIDQAEFANTVRGDKCTFKVDSVKNITKLGRTFDITLCIGLFYHVADIAGLVSGIGKITTEMAIVETALYQQHTETPLIRVAQGDLTLPGTFHPNFAALEALFKLAGFKKAEILGEIKGRGAAAFYK